MTGALERMPDWDAGGLAVTKTGGLCNCLIGKNGYQLMALVNRMLVNGAPYQEVYEVLSSLPKETFKNNRVPGYAVVRNHAQNHLPIKVAAMRKVLEQRAAEQGLLIEEGTQNILTNQAMVEIIARQGFADIVEGKSKPTIKETIEAIKLSAQMDKDATGTFDAVAAMAQMQRLMAAVQKWVPDDIMEKILMELNNEEEAVIVDENDYWPEEEQEYKVWVGKVLVQLPDMRGKYSDQGLTIWREEYPTQEEAEAFVMYWKTSDRTDMPKPIVIESSVFHAGD